MRILLTGRRWTGTQEPADNPIALLDLAALARAQGHEVDCCYLDRLPDGVYDQVGVSILSEVPGLLDVVKALRARFPRARIVIGGKWAQGADAEAEVALVRAGAWLWRWSGEEFFEWGGGLDAYPSWDARDLAALAVNKKGLMTSRGCPFSCAFCNNTEKQVRFFSARRTVDNLQRLFERGIKGAFFVDDVFTLSPSHMLGILEEAQRRGVPLRGRNMFFTHVNCITDATVTAMKLLEPCEVQIGLESGDDDMLRAMKKGFTAEAARAKLEVLKAAGLRVVGLFLVGFPGETVGSLQRTLEFAAEVRPLLRRVWVSFYQPIPGTPGWRMAQERGATTGVGLPSTRPCYTEEGLTKEALVTYRNHIMGLNRK